MCKRIVARHVLLITILPARIPHPPVLYFSRQVPLNSQDIHTTFSNRLTSLSRYSCFPRCIFSYCPTPMSFLPRNLTGALPRSYPRKVVSHFLAGINLSSCTASYRQYSFPQFRAKQKHRKMPTTQAEFLLSEGKPLTVLGQSQ